MKVVKYKRDKVKEKDENKDENNKKDINNFYPVKWPSMLDDNYFYIYENENSLENEEKEESEENVKKVEK